MNMAVNRGCSESVQLMMNGERVGIFMSWLDEQGSQEIFKLFLSVNETDKTFRWLHERKKKSHKPNSCDTKAKRSTAIKINLIRARCAFFTRVIFWLFFFRWVKMCSWVISSWKEKRIKTKCGRSLSTKQFSCETKFKTKGRGGNRPSNKFLEPFKSRMKSTNWAPRTVESSACAYQWNRKKIETKVFRNKCRKLKPFWHLTLRGFARSRTDNEWISKITPA